MKKDKPINGHLSAKGEQFISAVHVQNDITENKLSETELRDYIENANICMHWVDANGIIKWANNAELDLLGYTAEEYIGHHIAEFHVHRNKIDDILARLNCNEKLNKYESELRCKNGAVKTVQINSSVYSENGQFIHTRCVTIDVTDEKKLLKALAENENALRESEARYRQLAESLEAKVQEKTKDLVKKTEELKASEERLKESLAQLEFQNKELEQFVYAASHDLKEPLRKITLYSNYIAENSSNQLDEKSKDYLNRSINAVERMKTLIDDLLVYSRSTSVGEQFRIIDLNTLFNEIADQYKDTLEQIPGQLMIDKLPTIKAIPFQIKQLFYNLVENAVKYRHPNRPLTIKIQADVIQSDVKGVDDKFEKYHRVSITDNGIGFDSQYSKKIFEIFQRLQSKSKVAGTGIGLAICKKIVQNHHGFIDAVSQPDKGATFTVYLPLS
jgi:PAS domain S-box-containing protein